MLVGWEFLQRFAVRMDFQRNELTFYALPHFTYVGSGAAVPLILNKHGNGIYLDAKVDGIRGRLQLDSGNETGLFLNAAFVDKHHLPGLLHATLRGYNGKGLGGDAPEAWFARLHTLDLGSIILRNPVVRLLTAKDNYVQKLAGNIGQSTLKHFAVTVDCRHRVMYLEKLPGWDTRELFNRAGLIYDDLPGGDEVKTVFPGSPAESSGLKRGDLITAINGAKPADNLNDPAFIQPTGTLLHLTVRRDGVEHNYDVTLSDVL
ncbi:PDZ domain-containing protein [Granulicella sp. dw_53]|uniref:PDZ domain-containing protein n=1 Tax=Granulicella sp. dw_53 TaxID=2719792 RepID=UPI001BD2246A|nr:PDZ domain-containing protein [Granulicella sp. dw_53]